MARTKPKECWRILCAANVIAVTRHDNLRHTGRAKYLFSVISKLDF